MAATIPGFGRNDKAADIIAALRREGAVIVNELVAPDTMDELTARLAPAFAEMEPSGGRFFGYKRKSLGQLFARGPEFSEHLLLNELALEISDAILLPEFPASLAGNRIEPKMLPDPDAAFDDGSHFYRYQRDPNHGPNCHHYRVGLAGSLQVSGGGEHQTLHRDFGIYHPYLPHDPRLPEYMIVLNWSGTDFTLDNGATRIALGSHRWPLERVAEEHEIARAVMPKGSVVFWLGRVLHGLGASRSSEPRTGLLHSFSANWLATEENQYLAVPPQIARRLPERAQPLLGYRASLSLGFAPGLDSDNLLNEGGGAYGFEGLGE